MLSSTLYQTKMIFHGAQQLTVTTPSSMIKTFKEPILRALNANHSSAFIVELLIIKAKHAKNTKFQEIPIKLIKLFRNSLKAKNLNNALSASFGFKNLRAATT